LGIAVQSHLELVNRPQEGVDFLPFLSAVAPAVLVALFRVMLVAA